MYQSYHNYLNVRGNTEELISSVLGKLLGGVQYGCWRNGSGYSHRHGKEVEIWAMW